MDTQRLILFVVFSFSLLMLWENWQQEQAPKPAAVASQPAPATAASSSAVADVPTASQPAKTGDVPAAVAAVAKGQRIRVETDSFKVELDTLGADIRSVELLQHADAEHREKNFMLLSDQPQHTYIAQSGFIGGVLPNHKSLYQSQATSYTLQPGQNKLDVKLTWQGNGISVDKIYTFERGSHVIGVRQVVHNQTAAPIQADAYYQLVRHGRSPESESYFMQTFTGVGAYTDKDKYHKTTFTELTEGKLHIPPPAQDGWIGLVQHYFVSAWVPQDKTQREYFARKLDNGLFAVGLVAPVAKVAANASQTTDMKLYVGPQEQETLKKLAPGLDLVVDYGWLTVIAAPLFWVLSLLNSLVGNWGVAIILLTILIKLAFYPLSAASYRSMAQLKVLGPKLQKLKEQFGDDKERMHKAMMDMYKTEKINPLGGCLPILVQIPVFIALYWVLLGAVELRNAPFFGWITDLSVADPYYVLPIIMGITMIIQTKLNPAPTDPIQAKVMTIMPIVFSVFFFFFPAGLVLYWLVNNVVSIAQQWQINRSIEQAKLATGKR